MQRRKLDRGKRREEESQRRTIMQPVEKVTVGVNCNNIYYMLKPSEIAKFKTLPVCPVASCIPCDSFQLGACNL
jgi:hypothetical protein